MSDAGERDIDSLIRELAPDIAAVRRWGEEHEGSFLSVKLDRVPRVMVAVLLWGEDIPSHEVVLHAMVPHPDRLRVEASPYAPAYLEEVKSELRELAMAHQGAIHGFGPGWGSVFTRLAADQEPLAARLHARYGAAVTLTLGHFPYPVGRPVTSADRVSRGSPPPPQVVTIDGLDARLELSSDHIVAGRNGHGTVVLTNTGAVPLELRTAQPLVAVVLAPETGEVVGGYTGAVAGVGLNVHLAPGGQASVQVLFGTASFRADLGFVLPAGRYLVRAEVPVHSHPPRHGGARQVLAVPPCRLTVAPVVPPELRN